MLLLCYAGHWLPGRANNYNNCCKGRALMFRGIFCVLAVALGAVVFPLVAAAQQSSLVLEEVIVTAQKRTQSLQDVPIAITAFS
jgi:outer membrane receptor protein involved in Fe transport